MPRKTTPAPESKLEVLDEASIQNNMNSAAMAVRSKQDQELLELCELAGDVRGIQVADWTANILRAAKVRLFDRVRESNQIKHLPIRTAEGIRRAKDIQEFCNLAFGRSYTVMFEASQTLASLGEDAYDAATRIGLNRSALRAARALPPEKLETVRLAISGGGSKAEVLSVIEDLAERAQKAEAAVEEVKAERTADKELLAKRNARIDKLERDAGRIDKLPPEDALAHQQQQASRAARHVSAIVQGELRQAMLAVENTSTERGDQSVFLAGLVGQIAAHLAALREEFNLPDLSNAEVDVEGAEVLRKGLAQFRAARAGGGQ